MTEDPTVPEDGTCAGCGRDKNPKRSRRYAARAAERDPFCSTDCCKRYHGVAARTELVGPRAGA